MAKLCQNISHGECCLSIEKECSCFGSRRTGDNVTDGFASCDDWPIRSNRSCWFRVTAKEKSPTILLFAGKDKVGNIHVYAKKMSLA